MLRNGDRKKVAEITTGGRALVVVGVLKGHQMKLTRGVALVSMIFVACGGSIPKPAAPTTATSSSQLSLDLPGDEQQGMAAGKIDLSGPAFAQADPENKALMIYVFDPGTQPTPTCDNIGLAGMMKQTAGVTAAVVIKEFSGASGKTKGAMGMFVQGDASKLTAAPPGAMLDATTVDLTTYDAKTIEAKISSDPSAKAQVSGTIHGTACPSTSMSAQVSAMQGATTTTPSDVHTSSNMYQVQIGTESVMGTGLNTLAKLDPKTKVLAITTWDPSEPQPPCDVFSTPEKGTFENGTALMIYARGVGDHGPGKYVVNEAQFIHVGSSAPKPKVVALNGTIDIHQFDDKDFKADLDAAVKDSLNGSIEGHVCPNGHID
ncbi:MAG: hypothetical protein ABI183_07545, partial [Polyangiaceae bacterium]